MTNAELLQEIRDRIERLRLEAKENCPEQTINRNYTPTQWQAIGEYNAYEIVGLFLSSLESEKPMNQKGLEREIERCLWKLSDDPSNEELRMFARNFYDLGCRHTAEKYDEIEYNRQRAEESVCKDLEKEIDFQTFSKEMGAVFALPKERTKNTEEEPLRWEYEIARHFAQWQKEQMMKEAVVGEVCIPNVWVEHKEGKELVVRAEISKELGFKFGDKVRVIVLPKED